MGEDDEDEAGEEKKIFLSSTFDEEPITHKFQEGKFNFGGRVKVAKTNESKSSTRKTNYGKKIVYEDEGK